MNYNTSEWVSKLHPDVVKKFCMDFHSGFHSFAMHNENSKSTFNEIIHHVWTFRERCFCGFFFLSRIMEVVCTEKGNGSLLSISIVSSVYSANKCSSSIVSVEKITLNSFVHICEDSFTN